jgi:GABA(A) receptor-associated protein
MSEIKKISFDDRKKQSEKILSKYPDKCPIYLSFDSNVLVKLGKKCNLNKYIVTSELTLGQFLAIIRNKINFTPYESLTLFIEEYKNDKLKSTIVATNSSTIGELYSKNKDDDGFLYLRLFKENVFG